MGRAWSPGAFPTRAPLDLPIAPWRFQLKNLSSSRGHITFGAMGDSYYEYLLKLPLNKALSGSIAPYRYVQTDKTEPEWKEVRRKALL